MKLLLYKLKRVFHFFKTGLLQGLPAQIRYNFPDKELTIIAITGTDGKTTTSSLLSHILNENQRKTALISTVGAASGSTAVDTGFHVTAPQPDQVFAFLRQAVQDHCRYVVLEATSHGEYQYRTWGITPDLAGLTNISHEHLDYHISYEEYVKAKLLLLKRARRAYINAEDLSFRTITKLAPQSKFQTYAPSEKLPKVLHTAVNKRFSEAYNRDNAHLAINLALELGLSEADIARAIESFPGVPGRMEVISQRPVKVIVDFAHTPNALERALVAGKTMLSKNQKLIAVYGSAGLRDSSKRPLMGKAGVTHADFVVLTAEDPRSEDVWSIIRQMKEQLESHHDKIISIPDRAHAIEFAITQLAKPGDLVMILGKGHEKSMCFGTTEVAWSDQDVARSAISKLS